MRPELHGMQTDLLQELVELEQEMEVLEQVLLMEIDNSLRAYSSTASSLDV